MILTLTNEEFERLQTLCEKGYQSMKKESSSYNDVSVPTYFRNRCKEELKVYDDLIASLPYKIKRDSYEEKYLTK